MNEEQMIAVLQRVHELTNNNCPEGAGAAWIALMGEIVWIARATDAGTSVVMVIEQALRSQDIDPNDLG